MPGPAGVAPPGQTLVIDKPDLARIIDLLWKDGYTVVGPTIAQGAIIFDEVRGAGAVAHRLDGRARGGNVPAQAPRRRGVFRLCGRPTLVEEISVPCAIDAVHDRARPRIRSRSSPSPEPAPRYAFLGARSCDLHAIEIQDRVFMQGPHVDPHYQARREAAFIIAVNCAQAAATCFCTSMKTGPKAVRGFDLALTELAGRRSWSRWPRSAAAPSWRRFPAARPPTSKWARPPAS